MEAGAWCCTRKASIQSWCCRWQIRSAIEGASSGTWKRLRNALVNPARRGAGRDRRVVCSWRMVRGELLGLDAQLPEGI